MREDLADTRGPTGSVGGGLRSGGNFLLFSGGASLAAALEFKLQALAQCRMELIEVCSAERELSSLHSLGLREDDRYSGACETFLQTVESLDNAGAPSEAARLAFENCRLCNADVAQQHALSGASPQSSQSHGIRANPAAQKRRKRVAGGDASVDALHKGLCMHCLAEPKLTAWVLSFRWILFRRSQTRQRESRKETHTERDGAGRRCEGFAFQRPPVSVRRSAERLRCSGASERVWRGTRERCKGSLAETPLGVEFRRGD